MDKEDLYKKMSASVEEGDADALLASINDVINEADPLELVRDGMMPGLKHVGDLFGKGDVFLPELLMSAETFQEGMKVIEPKLAMSEKKLEKLGTVVFGTVLTDIHEIGKNVVITLMKTRGFEVIDLGANVSPTNFVEKAQAAGAATRMYFDEALACLLMLIASGSGIEDVHPGKAKITNGCTPVDMEFTCQLGHACVGMTRKEANQIIDKVLPKYVNQLMKHPAGETLDECYDLDYFKPRPHFEKLYMDFVEDLEKEFGIELYKY